MAEYGLEPLARIGTKLGSGGPSALDVAMSRNKAEDDLGANLLANAAKVKAAETAAAGKVKAAVVKERAKTVLGNVFMGHSQLWDKERADHINMESQFGMRHAKEPDKYGDPTDPNSEEYRLLELHTAQMQQRQSNSDQAKAWHTAMTTAIEKDKASGNPIYTADAQARVDEAASNPDAYLKGEIPSMVRGIVDVDKQVKDHFGAFADLFEQSAWANQEGTASGTTQSVDVEKLKELSQNLASNAPIAQEIAFRMADEELVSPERRAFIEAEAKKNKISTTAMFILDEAKALYGHTRRTQISEQVSDTGYGATKDKAAAIWFAEYLKGTQEGTYETTPETEKEIADWWAIDGEPKDAPAWWRTKQVPTGVQLDNTLNGMVWDSKEFYDKKADKNIKVQREVKSVLIDPTTEKYMVQVAPAGKTWDKKTGEVVVVPFDQAESKMGKNILGFNKDVIGAQAAYDVAAEKEGYGQRKGTSAGNIVKTNPQGGAYVPGRQNQSGPYIPGRK